MLKGPPGLALTSTLVLLLITSALPQRATPAALATSSDAADAHVVTAQAGGFSDVPAGHTFADDIAWLASTGITQGRADATFGLNEPVTRGAMAAFLHRYDQQSAGPQRGALTWTQAADEVRIE